MCRGPKAWVVAVCLAVGALTLSEAAFAQTVEGRALDVQSGQPLAGVAVRLLGIDGDRRASAIADANGRYRLRVDDPGTYRLEGRLLGYETTVSEPFELVSETTVVALDLSLRAEPIPIRGIEVTDEQVTRRLRQFFGTNPALLRIEPVRAATIRDHARRGNSLPEMMSWLQIPNFQVTRSREGPCYQVRGRGCLPIYLDGARLSAPSSTQLPLDMLSTVVIVLPNELVAYPSGAVHLYTIGYMR